MPREFSEDAARSTFELPPLTRQQIKEESKEQRCDAREVVIYAVQLLHRLRRMPEIRTLILDLDLPFEEVIIRAVAELWQRETGEAGRDLAAELDELRRRLDELQQPQ